MLFSGFALFMVTAEFLYGESFASTKTNTMYGKHFLIALPYLHGYEAEVFFYFTTLYEKNLQVYILMPWLRERLPYAEFVDLTFDKPVSFMINWEYHHPGGTGHKFSYMTSSAQDYSLTVLMVESETSSESFQAIPVELWDTDYYVVTMLNQPSVQIISYKGPNLVTIKLNKFNPDIVYEVYHKQYGSEDLLEIELKEFEAFGLEDCNANVPQNDASLTGTHINGLYPIGVITGNCRGTTRAARCTKYNSLETPSSLDRADVVVEMLLPTSLYGTEFIVVVPERRKSPSFVTVLSIYDETEVRLSLREGGKHTTIMAAREYIELTSDWTLVSLLTSSKPVQVLLVQRSYCVSKSDETEELGNPSMTLLMPTSMFYDTYKWSTHVTDIIKYIMYAGLVVEDEFLTAVQINDQPLPKLTWIFVVGKYEWRSTWTLLPEGHVTVRSTNQRAFGCYFYGLAKHTSFMHTGGFITKPIDGSWGEWGDWRCARNCTSGIRKRECNNPEPANGGQECDGDKEERFNSNCPRKCIKTIANSMGLSFIVALPGTSPAMKHIFVMCTNEAFDITVQISTPGFPSPEESLQRKVTFSKENPGTYEVTGSYISTVETGHKFTYMLSSIYYFNVNVLIWFSRYSIATVQALATEYWGKKYFAATLSGGPFIQIATVEGPNDVTITVRMTAPKRVELIYNEQKVKDGQVINVQIERLQGFALSICSLRDSKMRGTLTGTKIEAVHRIGVISGNCEGQTESVWCHQQNKIASPTGRDAAAEMLMPIDMYGRDFITWEAIHRISPGMVQTVAGESDTKVHVHPDQDGSFLKYVLQYEGDMRMLNLTFRRITSNKGIMVMIVHRVPCQLVLSSYLEEGSTSISLLIPSTLFVDIYLWGTHEVPEVETKHFVVLVIEDASLHYIYMDGTPLERTDWRNVTTMKWLAKTLPVAAGCHMVREFQLRPFGCYVYGIGTNYGLLNSPGYKSARINAPCVSNRGEMLPADHIDNDCDGKLDEEVLNHRDDDDDGSVDEDLGIASKIIYGHWGEWTAWICASNCSMHSKYRWCNNPEPKEFSNDCRGTAEHSERADCQSRCLRAARYTDATVDGSWSEWSEWHCGYDFTENSEVKKRKCVNPPPKLGGRTCFGYTESFRFGGCRDWWSENKGKTTPEEVEEEAFKKVFMVEEPMKTQTEKEDEPVTQDTKDEPVTQDTTDEQITKDVTERQEDDTATAKDVTSSPNQKTETEPFKEELKNNNKDSGIYKYFYGLSALLLIPMGIIMYKLCKSNKEDKTLE